VHLSKTIIFDVVILESGLPIDNNKMPATHAIF